MGTVGLGVLLLSGCVYLRLLTIKNQLKDFEKNFDISGQSDLEIIFKNPVLSSEDVTFLIGAPPVRITREGGVFYHYDFNLSRSSDSASVPLSQLHLTLGMRDKKLERIIVPEHFMLIFPRHVLLETLRRAADAEVLELKKIARVTLRLSPSVDAELPSRTKTRLLLGDPQEIQPEGEWENWIYHFRLARERRPVPIEARLSFDQAERLHRVFIRWDTSKVDATFLRD